MKKFSYYFGLVTMVSAAPSFLVAAFRGDVALGLWYLFGLVLGAAIHFSNVFSEKEEDVAPPQPVEDLIAQWLIRRDERRELCQERLELGIMHAKANREVVLLEEELIMRFGGQQVLLPDGRIATIGTPGCRLADRMRVSS